MSTYLIDLTIEGDETAITIERFDGELLKPTNPEDRLIVEILAGQAAPAALLEATGVTSDGSTHNLLG